LSTDGANNAGVGEQSQTEVETAEEVDGRAVWKAGVEEVVPQRLAPALAHGGGFVKRGGEGGARDAGFSLAPAFRGRCFACV
jgi:hypothetical protein